MSTLPYDLERTYIPLPWLGDELNVIIRKLAIRSKYGVLTSSIEPRLFLGTGVIFVNVPKNAGSSVCRALYGEIIAHHSAQFYRIAWPGLYHSLPTYALLRHPSDRFVSAYSFLRHDSKVEGDRRFSERVLSHFSGPNELAGAMIRDPALLHEVMLWSHFRPQHEFVCDEAGELIVDFLGEVGRIDVFVRALEAAIGRTLSIGYRNKGSRPVHAGVDEAPLRTLYGRDFELWNRVHGAGGLLRT
jgi:chondroitin 4-sulfotransferase 11